MSNTPQEQATVVTPEFRAAFVNVFETTKTPNGQDRYQLTALFPAGADLKELKKLAKQALEEKWGTDPAKHPKGLRSPFRKQSEKAGEYKGFEDDDDAIFINMASTLKPGICNDKGQDIINKDEFYSGCFARAQVNAYAYDKGGNRGVAFGLNFLMKTKDGERLGGGRSGSAAAAFGFEAAASGGSSADSLFD